MRAFIKKPIPLWALFLGVLVTGASCVTICYFAWFDSKEPAQLYPNSFSSGQKMVFFDWWNVQAGYHIKSNEIIDQKVPTGVKIAYFRPSSINTILTADKPWESNFLGLYSTIMYDGGKYRLWYEGYPYWADQRDSNAHLCYAESVDGLTWTKPNLGITGFNGTADTNILFSPDMHPQGYGLHGATVFKDPHGSEKERYKLTYCGKALNGESVVFGATSRDGLHWNLIEDPMVWEHADSQTSITWDESKQKYIGYFRHWENDRRHITYAETTNFRDWPEPVLLIGDEGYLDPSTDYYTNGYLSWPDAPGSHLMFPTMYYRGLGDEPGDSLAVQFGVSRNGLNWQFPLTEPFVPVGPTGSGREGMVFAGSGIVELPDKKWALSLGCCPKTHNMNRGTGEYENTIQLASIRQDGFAGIVADGAGEFWTIPITFDASKIQINANISATGWIKLELIDHDSGNVVSGKTIANCDQFQGDILWETVSWGSASDLTSLRNQDLEIHIQMSQACIYALKFT